MAITLEKDIPVHHHKAIKDPRTNEIKEFLKTMKVNESIFIDVRDPGNLPKGHEPNFTKLIAKDLHYVRGVLNCFCRDNYGTKRYSHYFTLTSVNQQNKRGIRVWKLFEEVKNEH